MGPETRSRRVYNYDLPRRKMRGQFEARTLPTRFVTSRLHFYGARQNVSAVWKMSQYLRTAPVTINDPVCVLKSPGAALWKA